MQADPLYLVSLQLPCPHRILNIEGADSNWADCDMVGYMIDLFRAFLSWKKGVWHKQWPPSRGSVELATMIKIGWLSDGLRM